MSIRFDKDARRATNGPMIFFSDPSAMVSLSEEIRGAIESQLAFYAYRMPGDLMISFGSSEHVVEGIGERGFVIAPFLPDMPILTIPYRPAKRNIKADGFQYRFPSTSTPREEHAAEIDAIKSALSTYGTGKIVASRVIVNNGRIDVGSTFAELSRRHPNAFVFCFSTPLTGCWIGASPELLLEASGNGVKTMALAGTRAAGESGEWDCKNLEEQQMVTDFISETLSGNGLDISISPLYTRNAGKVEHLCTDISASSHEPMTTDRIQSILHQLSPTPALCGTPRDVALDTIRQTERFDRGCYGGFCGPFRSPADFSLFVTLRCCCIEMEKILHLCRGGITLRSNTEAEWQETEAKASTIRDALIIE